MRDFTSMCLDGPVDREGNLVTLSFEPPCLIASVQIMLNTGWDGKRFGDFREVKFFKTPSPEDFILTGTGKNVLQWKGGAFAYDYTVDLREKKKFVDYLANFSNEIRKHLEGYLGANYPQDIAANSDSPTIELK